MSTNPLYSLEIFEVPPHLCPDCFKPITPPGPPIYNSDNCSCHELGTTNGGRHAEFPQGLIVPVGHPFTSVIAANGYCHASQSASSQDPNVERQSLPDSPGMSHSDFPPITSLLSPNVCPGQEKVEVYSLGRYLNQPVYHSNGISDSRHRSSHSSFDSTKANQGSSSAKSSNNISSSSSSGSSKRSIHSLGQETFNGAGHWDPSARSCSSPAIMQAYYDNGDYPQVLDIAPEGSYYS